MIWTSNWNINNNRSTKRNRIRNISTIRTWEIEYIDSRESNRKISIIWYYNREKGGSDKGENCGSSSWEDNRSAY